MEYRNFFENMKFINIVNFFCKDRLVMSYFVISFLPSFYLRQKSYITVQKANSFPVYFVFLYMKALYKCTLLYFTNQNFLIKLSPHFVDGKSNTLKF